MVEPIKQSRWKRAPSAAVGSKICPSCKTAGPARLFAGQVCASCEAKNAWSKLGDDARLVIDRSSIDEALRRRAGEAAAAPLWRRIAVWIWPAVTLAIAIITGWSLAHLFTARQIGPLGDLIDGLQSSARRAAFGGIAGLVSGSAGLIWLSRRRYFRRLLMLGSYTLGIAVGIAAAPIGLLGLFSATGIGQYTSMPVRESLGVSASTERIVNATVVVLAPDADGNARNLGIGTGAVIAADDARAWIVTCSHVAMPYAAVSSFRKPADAQPVWVQLSDGREGKAVIRWLAPPPLDVALVELDIPHPPEPVPIASDTGDVDTAASVTFVPNPYRSGWKVQRGQLLKRETHHTPAGTYDLLFTDLPVTFGDSGSGLFDARGQLIGLNTWTRIADNAPSQGISLPTETMRTLVDAIQRGRLDQLDRATAGK